MMYCEFVERTGFEPMIEEYEDIEKAYTESDLDKDTFCKEWIKDGGVKRTIHNRAKTIKELRTAIAEKDKEISRLNTELDKELEWRPYIRNVPLSFYNELKDCEFAKELTDDEAKELISNEFGFEPRKIKIIHTVTEYEINRHRLCRITGASERKPLWASTDWNYIRFNCGCMMYEMHNGNLEFYID